jgi:hypothetical protein
MHRFFRKGTVVECCKLLPEELEPDELFKCAKSLRAPVQATPQPHQLQNATTSAEEYFKRFITCQEQRLKRVVKFAQHIAEFQHQESVVIDGAYSASSIQETPIALVKATFERISSKQDPRLYRCNLLYFGNAVDQLETMPLEGSQGRSNKSVAFDLISQCDKKKRNIVGKMYSHACRHLELLETGGPGSLLSMNAPSS